MSYKKNVEREVQEYALISKEAHRKWDQYKDQLKEFQ